ncbi:RcnB family protein [Novosphingobium sediminicola]|uniref:Ni/Co efflux regulator RcnB n=1 Tax=Novosphingobium sediminicola TaxID=563162 RepID=A0A7W6CK56_9SPHN|nr:RcnB family protein [Novosphingobium sediminicola]MBB3955220.1 Ni/Co efflux regulator RcnB [Novosphingobium sediminicola]
MRKIISLALCALILAPTAASADPDHGRGGRGHWDHGRHGGRGPEWHGGGHGWAPQPGWRQFRRGERFYAERAPNYVVINDYRRWHRLRPPPRGYRWVRSGNDALLIGITSGIVASVIVGAIR